MTDYDADEPVAPIKPAPRASIWSDRILAGTGVALACAAGLFPWYVFFHQDQFGPLRNGWGLTRDLPDGPARNVFSVSPQAMVNSHPGGTTEVVPSAVDPVVTATVSQIGPEDPSNETLPQQPFPGQSGFHLLHVVNGRALIEDRSGMYMVQIGSILPDNSKVATIEQRDGKWVVISSTGAIYGN